MKWWQFTALLLALIGAGFGSGRMAKARRHTARQPEIERVHDYLATRPDRKDGPESRDLPVKTTRLAEFAASLASANDSSALQGLLDALESEAANGDVPLDLLRSMVAARWIEVDPASAATPFSERPAVLAAVWAESDPEAALEFVLTSADSDAASAFLTTLARNDPLRAFSAAALLLEANPNASQNAEIAESLAFLNPTKALEALPSMGATIYATWAKRDAGAAFQNLLEIETPNRWSSAMPEMAAAWMRQNPSEGLKCFEILVDSAFISPGEGAAAMLSSFDTPADAIAWIGRLPDALRAQLAGALHWPAAPDHLDWSEFRDLAMAFSPEERRALLSRRTFPADIPLELALALAR